MRRILCVRDRGQHLKDLGCKFDPPAELIEVDDPLHALSLLSREDFDQVLLVSSSLRDPGCFGRLLENEEILQGMPDGVVLLDGQHSILWANDVFNRWAAVESVIGNSFYQALGDPEILGPDFCPFHTALATDQAANSSLRVGDSQYFHVHAAPLTRTVHDLEEVPHGLRSDGFDGPAKTAAQSPPADNGSDQNDGGEVSPLVEEPLDEGEFAEYLVVTVRDTTEETLQQQKLDAIHRAGMQLADLLPEEIFQMAIAERIELLKSNILQLMQDLLNFDVMEVRLLDQSTQKLEILLSVGIDSEAALRPLYAKAKDNGVTGFVAATGKSYLCEDTTEDPLYIDGLLGAKSSLTVPLIWHEQVIGSINVESPETNAFSESDLQFLELFSRDLAASLNTLELLVAQKANAAQESVDAIHSAIALPMDQILNDTAAVMERYIGHEPEVVQRLQSVLKNARDIKQMIHRVGETMAPAEAVPVGVQVEKRPILRARRVLVVDSDEAVRNDAHKLLERYGCHVETAADGNRAVSLGRASIGDVPYDAIIADIRLPDMSGYEFLMKLKEIIDSPPLILMSGFGYDPGHSIVKARQAGLPANSTLFKPFRLDQLLETVENTISSVPEASSVDESASS